MPLWGVAEVREFVDELQIRDTSGQRVVYGDTFAAREVNGAALLRLSDAELRDIGVGAMAHRRSLLEHVRAQAPLCTRVRSHCGEAMRAFCRCGSGSLPARQLARLGNWVLETTERADPERYGRRLPSRRISLCLGIPLLYYVVMKYFAEN